RLADRRAAAGAAAPARPGGEGAAARPGPAAGHARRPRRLDRIPGRRGVRARGGRRPVAAGGLVDAAGRRLAAALRGGCGGGAGRRARGPARRARPHRPRPARRRADRGAPYPHARDVLLLRAHLEGTAALLGGHARTAEAQQLLATGWGRPIAADRAAVRAAAPRVTAAGDDAELARDAAARTARLPTLAWRTAADALAAGAPVLVQVPRRGYLPALACARCRAPARCAHCSGPLGSTSGHAVPACRWCGRPAAYWSCPACGSDRLRAVV